MEKLAAAYGLKGNRSWK